jgi:preprotein translocase subunit YajC
MSFGYTVNVAAGIQGQVSHVDEKVRIREGSRLATRVPLPEYSKSHIRAKDVRKILAQSESTAQQSK